MVRREFRCRREDSVLIYCILESHEGMGFYSTLDHSAGDRGREIELFVPLGHEAEADAVLADLASKGCEMIELTEGDSA